MANHVTSFFDFQNVPPESGEHVVNVLFDDLEVTDRERICNLLEIDEDDFIEEVGAKWCMIEEVTYDPETASLALSLTSAWHWPEDFAHSLVDIVYTAHDAVPHAFVRYMDEGPNFVGWYAWGDDVDDGAYIDSDDFTEIIGSEMYTVTYDDNGEEQEVVENEDWYDEWDDYVNACQEHFFDTEEE